MSEYFKEDRPDLGQNVRVKRETHTNAAAYVQKKGKKLGHYVDEAIREKLERDGGWPAEKKEYGRGAAGSSVK
jgi:hypothetical protein